MPKNRLIYIGVLVVGAVALLYGAFQFTKFVQPALPYALGVGAIMIVGGIFLEANKNKDAGRVVKNLHPGEAEASNIKETAL